MPIELWCAPDVFMAQVRDEIIVLDLSTDQYHCLLDATHDILMGDNGSLMIWDGDVASDLLATALATDTPPSAPRMRPTAARRELIPPPHASVPAWISAVIALAAATVTSQRKSLAELISDDRPQAPTHRIADERIIQNVLSAGRAALPWIPFEGECLQRAFQMRWLLRRHNVEPEWVFGVRTWPFAAHCWLQLGDLVLADRLERVCRYTPIMVA